MKSFPWISKFQSKCLLQFLRHHLLVVTDDMNAQFSTRQSETSNFGEIDEFNLFVTKLVDNDSSFTELFPFLPSRPRAPLPLLPGSAAAALRRLRRAEVIVAKGGDLVSDAADRGELLPGGLPVLFGQRQSVEVLLFEAGPLPRGVNLQTVDPCTLLLTTTCVAFCIEQVLGWKTILSLVHL